MKLSLLVVIAAALITTLAASSPLSAAPAASTVVLPRATHAGQTTQYGHIKSLRRKGKQFEMRFDPAWWLTGVTAERACGCKPVPNDYFIVDEGHRLLTYVVPARAHVTVLVRTRKGVAGVTVAELAQMVAGKNPKHRPLLERGGGFWILIDNKYPGQVLALDQQFQP